MGRIKDLRASTIDRNEAIDIGVFSGRKWAEVDLILFVKEIIIKAIHMGSPILSVVIRWEVKVIVNGEDPHIFIIIIK